ncbi:LD-carboxypeptidase [bacterium]|nr:LD-carboxypeptidase [bacterium]
MMPAAHCPEPLKRGDTLGFVATARFLSEPELWSAKARVEALGFHVRVHPSCTQPFHQFGGTDIERAKAVNEMLNDPEIKALFVVRGGYGTVRMIDQVDFDALARRPIWICGYSDVTAFHAALQTRLGLMSLHSAMPVGFATLEPGVLEQTFSVLQGERPVQEFASTPWDASGTARGRLLGGNLSVLLSVLGSRDFPDCTGAVLLIEDVDEYLYHLDRMMHTLFRARVLHKVRAVLVGGLTQMKDHEIPFGWGAEALVREVLLPLGIPFAFDYPSGHRSENRPLVLGATVELDVTPLGNRLRYVD